MEHYLFTYFFMYLLNWEVEMCTCFVLFSLGHRGKDIWKFLIGHSQYTLPFGVIPVLLLSLQKNKRYDEGNPREMHLIYWGLFLFNHSLKGFSTEFLLWFFSASSVSLVSHQEWGQEEWLSNPPLGMLTVGQLTWNMYFC